MRGRAAGVAAAAALVLLAGCGGLPTSGPVTSGSRTLDDPRIGLLEVIPEGPREGASAEDVVRGFLLAASSASEDAAVARTFLTAAAARRWRPEDSTTLVDTIPVVDAAPAPTGTPAPSPATPDGASVQVAVSAAVVAEIDATGHYLQRTPGTRLLQTLTLRREGGQWRVDELPDGVAVSELDASRTLRAFPVYFATADARQLVADVRWFTYGSSTATRIVTELLAGASSWLAPAVRSGAPAGTRLRVGTVPVADGTAAVDLTDAVLQGSPEQRSLLLSQLRASLTRLPGVARVRVTVDGAELTRAGDGDVGDVPRTLATTDPRLVLLGPAGLSRWDRTAVGAVPGTGPGLASGDDAAHPAVGPAGGPFAVLDRDDRTLRVQAAGGELETALRSDVPLSPPSVDRDGWVWTVAAASGAVPRIVPSGDPAAPAQAVDLPADGVGGTVRLLRVSRDGARVVLVVEAPDGSTHVRVHGVVRGAGARPLRLTAGSPELVPGTADVLDASWLEDDRLVLLARPAAGDDPVPLVTQTSGPVDALPAVPGGVSVAAGWSERDVVVGTRDGRLLTRSGAEWVVFADGRDPAYPG
ncbi:LpqB family beta-propeller domain-containing protein [Kineococcus rubinsiae]|uniref:LpqB family beta-propeller domain-containing protein n=1 Tax=Kineococcus rubinsiae TaxID=2609562 RepID=UPI0014319DE6|nr:LpqB family beta-propeller domain-containing protein [Kineococcus rubinsiae]